MGATPRDLDRLASPRARLAGQARTDSVGLRRDRARPRRARARRDPLPLRGRAGRRARGARRRTASRPSAFGCTSCRPTASGFAIRRRRPCSTPLASVVLVNWAIQRLGEVRQLAADAGVGPRHLRGSPACRLEQPQRPDGRGRVVLEGGGIEVNGDGLLLVTEEWLLSDVQVRNPGLTREDYERAVRRVARHPADDLAGRRVRRRRHARSRRRHRAVRRARTRSCLPSKRTRPTRITRDRSTTCGGSSWPAASDGVARCAS